jgi:hypothetical protein
MLLFPTSYHSFPQIQNIAAYEMPGTDGTGAPSCQYIVVSDERKVM